MGSFNYNIFFNEALSQIEQEFEKEGKYNEFILWFNIKYVESKELKIIASVPSNLVKDKINSSGYVKLIESKIFELSGYNIKLEVIVKNDLSSQNTKEIGEKQTERQIQTKVEIKKHPQLNERYTFENFVKGDNNSFAYNASLAVSKAVFTLLVK